jgi:hypothetical protein
MCAEKASIKSVFVDIWFGFQFWGSSQPCYKILYMHIVELILREKILLYFLNEKIYTGFKCIAVIFKYVIKKSNLKIKNMFILSYLYHLLSDTLGVFMELDCCGPKNFL